MAAGFHSEPQYYLSSGREMDAGFRKEPQYYLSSGREMVASFHSEPQYYLSSGREMVASFHTEPQYYLSSGREMVASFHSEPQYYLPLGQQLSGVGCSGFRKVGYQTWYQFNPTFRELLARAQCQQCQVLSRGTELGGWTFNKKVSFIQTAIHCVSPFLLLFKRQLSAFPCSVLHLQRILNLTYQ